MSSQLSISESIQLSKQIIVLLDMKMYYGRALTKEYAKKYPCLEKIEYLTKEREYYTDIIKILEKKCN